MIKLVKIQTSAGIVSAGLWENEQVYPLSNGPELPSLTLSDILEDADPKRRIVSLRDASRRIAEREVRFLAPLDQQEVWAAGVTYRRSRAARMEESAGAALFYDKVYEADRPELFFKSNPFRVVAHDQPIRIRADATWNVPEPEMTLVINSRQQIVGYTIGNDMSSRDIEGENPLYLPQAKVYDACCALGPCIVLAEADQHFERAAIEVRILRDGKVVFAGEANTDQMARSYGDLVDWLTRECSFPQGACLLTGTGIVPGDDFTLLAGDTVEITIEGIGTLRNPVIQGKQRG